MTGLQYLRALVKLIALARVWALLFTFSSWWLIESVTVFIRHYCLLLKHGPLLPSRLPGAHSWRSNKMFCRLRRVSNNLTAAMITDGRKLMNYTFEAVERVSRSGRDHVERQMVFIATNIALSHRTLLLKPHLIALNVYLIRAEFRKLCRIV